jgi:hypothetical protein
MEFGHEMSFEEADRRYAELRRQRDSGALSAEEFDAQLKQLMIQDGDGLYWAKSRRSGEWMYYDGHTWIPGTPEGYSQGPQAQFTRIPAGLWVGLGIACAVVALILSFTIFVWPWLLAGLAIFFGFRALRSGNQTGGTATVAVGSVALLVSLVSDLVNL